MTTRPNPQAWRDAVDTLLAERGETPIRQSAFVLYYEVGDTPEKAVRHVIADRLMMTGDQ